tara:strand:- start:306 stop:584 length:279 start_codon:yes stop_codon:yes gene_type:complete
MIIGLVIDQFVATQKQESYKGQKLLLVQSLTPEGKPNGEPLLAIDGVNAGIEDRVLVTQEGWSANYILGEFFTPVDAAVVGIIDHIDLYDGS